MVQVLFLSRTSRALIYFLQGLLNNLKIYWTIATQERNIAAFSAGWSSSVARRAHNPKVIGSNPVPATKDYDPLSRGFLLCFI